jgi:DNA-binding GntR family transcriptional regulator
VHSARENSHMTSLPAPVQEDEEEEALELRRTAQEIIADRLRMDILSGVLPPGTRLHQAKVAKRMRTSTTPVREAFRELAVEGVLDLDPHRGVIVHEPSKQELLELYEMRSLLEPVCMTKAVERISLQEIAEADSLARQMSKERDPGAWVMLNNAFHSVLVDASRSPLLIASVNNLRNRSGIYIAASFRREPERMRGADAEHAAMVEACRTRDVAAMLEPLQSHIESTVELGSLYLATLA